MTDDTPASDAEIAKMTHRIRSWGRRLGFQQVGFAGIDLANDEARLEAWLEQGRHGEMDWMLRHGRKRTRPADLVEGTISVISARMDYLPPGAADSDAVMRDGSLGFVSRYALGRDYHKLLRRRLQQLADRIADEVGDFGYRVFVDSAPVLEKALARNAGLGWIGKHTNLIHKTTGSWFFLGEIYTDLPLPPDAPATEHCGTCRACIDACPTRAIVGPWELDARRCISYLTIEHPGSIPGQFRTSMGNRIYGCDDCQIVCPWNKFATLTAEPDFRSRHGLDAPDLVTLFAWSEDEFLEKTEGSAIRRIGHERWLRNIAVALGNAPSLPEVIDALQSRLHHPSAIVREHVIWALERHRPGRTETSAI